MFHLSISYIFGIAGVFSNGIWIIQQVNHTSAQRGMRLLYLNIFFLTQKKTNCNMNQISQWITPVSFININRTTSLFSRKKHEKQKCSSHYQGPFLSQVWVMNEVLISDKLTCVTAQMLFDLWDTRTQRLSYWLNVFDVHRLQSTMVVVGGDAAIFQNYQWFKVQTLN